MFAANNTTTEINIAASHNMSTKLIKPLSIAFLILYFLYLVISRTPASVGAWAAHKAVPNLWLINVTGTIWDGRASASQIDIDRASIPLGELNWELSPWSLLLLSPCLTFDAELVGQEISGNLCQQINGTSKIKDVKVETNVSVIQDLLPMQVGGHLSAHVTEAKVNAGQVSALNAQLSWMGVRVHNGESWMSLGSVAAKFSEGPNNGAKLKLFDLDGPVKLDIGGSWSLKNNWNLSGTVAPKDGAPTVITEALQIVGEEVESGVYKVAWP